MKRMLINATQQEELRMAMVDGQSLYDLNIELSASERKKANIYKGKITRIEPSLEAAFVDFGAERHGFLPLKEISSEYFVKPVASGAKVNIKDVLKEGQDIVVQIDKEERGTKGAALTTFVSLAGRFIVLKPNKPRSGGVSRRILGTERDLARRSLTAITVPDGMSVILRTAGIDRSSEELAWDLENLLTIWQAILNVVLERKSPFLIYRESNAVIRALRDYLTSDVGEILVDDERIFKEAREFVEQVMPHNLRKVKLYTDPVPLFTRFQIEGQIESAFTHSVDLPSGGSIVIDHTEALVSIDINSARATKGGDIEATALNTNLEAADEIARQLRIRDLGGLIVIDFIDMGPQRHQREVENRLRDAVRQDRARVQIGKISRFGLLEMSRQRLRPSLGESNYLTCPRCSGIGTIRSVESLALAILRIIGEEARKERTAKVIAQLPVEVATFLLNEKRDWVRNLESIHAVQVVLVANSALETPHYDVRRVRDDQTDLPENVGVSYSLAEAAPEPEAPQAILARKQVEPAAIAVLKPSKPAPKPQKQTGVGLIASLLALFSSGEKKKKKKPAKKHSAKNKSSGERDGRDSGDEKKRGQKSKSHKKQAARRDEEQRSGAKQKRPKKAGTGSEGKKPEERRKAPGKSRDQAETEGPQAGQSPREAGGDETQGTERRSSRSKRTRGGRRRRRSNEQPARDGQEGAAATAQNRQGDPGSEPEKAQVPVQKPRELAAPESSTSKASSDVAPAQDIKPTSGPATVAANTAEHEAAPAKDSRPQSEPGSGPSSAAVAKQEPASRPGSDSGSGPVQEHKRQVPQESDAKPEPGARPESEPKPAPVTKPEPARQAAEEQASKPKPEGRLLPWEPVQPAVPPKAKEPAETPRQDSESS